MKTHLTDENGNFKPTCPPSEGQMNLQTLEELMEFTYYHNNIPKEKKLETLLELEAWAEELTNQLMSSINEDHKHTPYSESAKVLYSKLLK